MIRIYLSTHPDEDVRAKVFEVGPTFEGSAEEVFHKFRLWRKRNTGPAFGGVVVEKDGKERLITIRQFLCSWREL